jgi:hypothetical protein
MSSSHIDPELGRVLINPFCKPLAAVRLAPKATELLQRREFREGP